MARYASEQEPWEFSQLYLLGIIYGTDTGVISGLYRGYIGLHQSNGKENGFAV